MINFIFNPDNFQHQNRIFPMLYNLIDVIFAYGGSANRGKYSLISRQYREICASYQYVISLGPNDVMEIFMVSLKNENVELLRLCLKNKKFNFDRIINNCGEYREESSWNIYWDEHPLQESGIYICKDIYHLFLNNKRQLIFNGRMQNTVVNVEMIKILIKNKKVRKEIDYGTGNVKYQMKQIKKYLSPVSKTIENYDINKFNFFDIYEIDADNERYLYGEMIEHIETVIKTFYITAENKEECRRLFQLFGEVEYDGKRKIDIIKECRKIGGKK